MNRYIDCGAATRRSVNCTTNQRARTFSEYQWVHMAMQCIYTCSWHDEYMCCNPLPYIQGTVYLHAESTNEMIWLDEDHFYSDVIISAMASQITGVSMVRSPGRSGAHQRKHQSSASLALWGVNSLNKGPVTRRMFPFDDVIMPTQLTLHVLICFERT